MNFTSQPPHDFSKSKKGKAAIFRRKQLSSAGAYALFGALLCMWACANETLEFASVPKIDAHVHLRYPGSEVLDRAVYDNFKLLSIIHDRYDLDWQMRFIEKQKAFHPQSLGFLTSFTMEGWDDSAWVDKTIEHLRAAFDKGALGVKVWKNIGIEFMGEKGEFVMINHPRFDPVLTFIESQNKSLAGHVGEPLDAWLSLDDMRASSSREYYLKNPQYHLYGRSGYPSSDQLIESYERMLEKHPGLRYIGCHLGSLEWSLSELATRLDRFPNMAVDLAARIDDLQLLDREEVRSFFMDYQDRILYGTDLSIRETHDPQEYAEDAHATWQRDWAYFTSDSTFIVPGIDDPVRGLDLPNSVVTKIYYSNAKKWYPGI